jgi:hypothetical protein
LGRVLLRVSFHFPLAYQPQDACSMYSHSFRFVCHPRAVSLPSLCLCCQAFSCLLDIVDCHSSYSSYSQPGRIVHSSTFLSVTHHLSFAVCQFFSACSLIAPLQESWLLAAAPLVDKLTVTCTIVHPKPLLSPFVCLLVSMGTGVCLLVDFSTIPLYTWWPRLHLCMLARNRCCSPSSRKLRPTLGLLFSRYCV